MKDFEKYIAQNTTVGKAKMRDIVPSDVKPTNGTEAINITVTPMIERELKVPYPNTQNIRGIPMTTYENKVQQNLDEGILISWERWPIPESQVDKAIEELGAKLKRIMSKNGLMR
jgi:hypothetical protein